MGSKGVALVVAVIGVIVLAAAGVYLYRHQGPAPSAEDKVATGEEKLPEPANTPAFEEATAAKRLPLPA